MAEITITKDNFEQEVLQSDIPVLVDFWAPWCGPCRMVAPVVEEIAREYEGKIKVGKVDVDEEPELAQQFGIMSIPTLIYFKEGKKEDQIIGLQTNYCIDATVKSAFERGYTVIIPEGTNTTFDNDYMTGETTVRYYNEDIWEELVESVSLEEALEMLERV